MLPGHVIAERFELERPASSGGMGTVYRALDRRTGAPVALKVLRSDDADARRRFDREARLLASLRHPHVVAYVDHGDSDGQLYLAMEWLDGEDLAHRLARGSLAVPAARALAQATAEALAHAHAAGVIHRDVKPANLFLVDGDPARVKIVDFGVARGEDLTALTRAGGVVGTPAYMAPEQARADDVVDARADLFGLGCVLFECLAGRAAFVARDALALLFKILVEEPPPLRELRGDIPAELDRLVTQLLAKQPAARPAGATAVAELLAGLTTEVADASGESAVALTAGEQRLVCALVGAGAPAATADPDTDASAPTIRRDDYERRARVRRIAAPFGAGVEWLADGGLIAVWRGGAMSASDQVALAARCALALRDELGTPLAIGTGLAELRASVPVGPMVEGAVALLRAAPAGDSGIRVDDTTARLLELRFDLAGGLLLGQRAAPAGARTLLGRASPCVGRDRELAHLNGLIDACIEDRVAAAALVIGAPGIGKSRLLHELLAGLRARGLDAELWTACGDPVAGGAPLSLLAQAVPRTGLEARGDDVRDFLDELAGPSADATTRGTTDTVRVDPQLRAESVRRGFIGLLAHLTARRPLVVVLDDLHWGDGATIRLIDAALGELRDAPLFVLGLARPELRDTFPRLWSERRVDEIRLTTLRPRSAEALVRHALGGDATAATVEKVVDRAAGNPFFLEELIRRVAEHGDDALPETVLALAAARLERLEPAARQVLRAASVHGDAFTEDGVLALLDAGAAPAVDLGARLADLAEREVLVRGDSNWRFRHAYLRDAAYSMLTDADRALGHRLAGEHLERTGGEAAVRAEHFELARDPRAADNYLVAARQALRRSDPDGAVALAARGEHAPGADPRTVDELRRFRAGTESWRGDFRAVDELATLMLASSPAGSKPWWHAATMSIYSGLWLARPAALRRSLRRFAETTPAPDAFMAYGRALGATLPATYTGCVHDFTEPMFQRFVQNAAPMAARDPMIAGMVQWLSSSRAYFYEDDPWRAIALDQAARPLFEQAGDTQRAIHIQGELAMYVGDIGDMAAHEADNRYVLSITSHMGLGPTLALGYLAYNMCELGRVAEAREMASWSLARSLERGFCTGEASARAGFAAIALAEGRPDEAEREATRAIRVGVTAPRYEALAYAGLIRARLALGKVAAAVRAARAAVAMTKRHRVMGSCDVFVHLWYAEALAAAGDPAAPAAFAAAADRVHARAARAPDDAARAVYLTGFPAVARTIQRASEFQ